MPVPARPRAEPAARALLLAALLPLAGCGDDPSGPPADATTRVSKVEARPGPYRATVERP